MRHFARVIAAYFHMTRLERWSYPAATVNRLVTIAGALFVLYYATKALQAEAATPLYDGDVFLFIVTGYAFMQVLMGALAGFPGTLRMGQLTGHLEACMMTRTPFWQLVLAMPAYDLAAIALRAVGIMSVAFVLSTTRPGVGAIATATLFGVLGTVCFLALGMISAAVTLTAKRGDPVGRLIVLTSALLTGAYFPRDVLPPLVARAGAWLPIAPALDGMRGALLEGASLSALGGPLLRLAVLLAVLLPGAAIGLRLAIRQVQKDGSLTHY